jgi:hypothetical protein
MNRRSKNRSVGRTVGATELRGETRHQMVRRPIFITRQSSCARVWEEGQISSTSDEPMVKRREGVGSSDGAKFANREQQSAQTPSPDVPTLEPTGRRFIRR